MLFADCLKNNNLLYAFPIDYNVLIEYDLISRNANAIGTIPKEPFSKRWLVSKMFIYNEKILLVPCNATDIWIYDLKLHNWNICEIDNKSVRWKFANAFIINSKVYMIGCCYESMAIYDFEMDSLYYYEEPYNIWKVNKDDIFCRDYFLENKSVLFLPCCTSNMVAEIDLRNMKCKMHIVGEKDNRYESIGIFDGECWLTPRKGNKLIVWNMRDSIKSINMPIQNKAEWGRYCGVTKHLNKIFFWANKNAKSGWCYSEPNKIEWNNQLYSFCRKEEAYEIVQTMTGEIYFINDAGVMPIVISDIIVEGLFAFKNDEAYHEDSVFTLPLFIEKLLIEE